MKAGTSLVLLLVLVACGRTDRPAAPPPTATAIPVLTPWSWHPLGDLAVIEGEVPESMELILEGRSIRERRYAEQGPVRWELYRPPDGESAVLRTAEGRELARFEFTAPPLRSRSRAAAPPVAARPAPPPRPPAPKPLPRPPAPRIRAETRPPSGSLLAVPERKAVALPSIQDTTAGPPTRAAAPSFSFKLRPEPEPPPPAVRAETRLANGALSAVPDRKPFALPSAHKAPLETAGRQAVPSNRFALKPDPEPPPPRVRAATRQSNGALSAVPDRKALALPSIQDTTAGSPTHAASPSFAFRLRPEPEPPPPSVRAETRLANGALSTVPGRKSFDLPSAHEAPPTAADRGPMGLGPGFTLKPLPEPPAPRVRAEASLRNLPVSPIPGRRTMAFPSTSEVPSSAPQRAPSQTPSLLDSILTGPARTPSPTGAASAWPGMGEALNLIRGPGGRKRLLLSFDGGSTAEVATEVLDLLKARGIHTTLFLTGAFIRRFPILVKRMAAEGHEIGNHTMNHPHFAPGMKRDPKWTRERIQRELLEADAALVRLLGRPMDPYWRAPYGEHTAEIRRWAEELGYRHVGWSEGADTLDWATTKERKLYRSGEAIVQRLEKRLGRDGDGLIVLMHLGSARELGDRPTQGLGAFMDRALGEGWTFVSAGAFLQALGKPVWDSHQRLALLNGPASPGR